MKKYRTLQKQRLAVCSIGCILITIMGILIQLQWWTQNSILISYQTGILCGMFLLSLIQILKSFRCLKEDAFCKKQYCKELDERKQMIKMRSGSTLALLSSTIIFILAILAGSYHITFFYAMNFCAFLILIISLCLKLFYTYTY